MMESQMEKDQGREYPVPVSDARLPSTEFREAIPAFQESADLRDYLEVVLRRKWLVLTILLGAFITTLVISLVIKPVFKANGRLELSLQAPKVTKFEDVVATQLQTREFMQTQVKLLQSDSLSRRVIEKLDLSQHAIFKKGDEGGGKLGVIQSVKEMIKGWLRSGGEDQASVDQDLRQLRDQKQIEEWFSTNLTVQPERDTTIVSLAFSSTDPMLARDIVNNLIQEFIGWQMDKRIEAAGSAKRQLEKQIEQVRIQLEKSEANLNRFAQKAGIVSLDSNLNLVYRQLEEINGALAAAEADRISKEAMLKQAERTDAGSLSQVLENPLIQKLREEYIKVQAEYEELNTTFKDEYPSVKTLRAKMTDIQRRIAAEENRISNSLKNEYLAAVQRENDLREKAEEKKNRALQLNTEATQYKILEREVESNKQIYQSLLERAKEIDANVGTELGNIQVVDYAQLPLVPYKPRVRLNLLLAIVVGLMGGVGLAFFLEYLDNTVKGVDEISDRFQIPVLGVVPLADDDEVKDLDRLVQIKPRAAFSEAIRTTKVSIELSSAMDQPPRSILISSTSAGEGKSTISNNLAQTFASSERKVMLIDADLRKPRLHKVYSGYSNGNGHGNGNGNGNGHGNGNGNGHKNGMTKGLSQYLSGLCKFEEIVQNTGIKNLYFIPAGPTPPNPAELLASNRMKKLLDVLGRHFDQVVVDGPPFAGFADVLVLGNAVDGVILVSTLGQTHREALRMFRKGLYNVRGHLLGSIVNRLNMNRHYSGYYAKYYKYYHSYYHPYGDEPAALPAEVPQEQHG